MTMSQSKTKNDDTNDGIMTIEVEDMPPIIKVLASILDDIDQRLALLESACNKLSEAMNLEINVGTPALFVGADDTKRFTLN